MEYPYKEVYFSDYCPKCKHEKKGEDEDPCYECLSIPNSNWSHKPTFFEEKEKLS